MPGPRFAKTSDQSQLAQEEAPSRAGNQTVIDEFFDSVHQHWKEVYESDGLNARIYQRRLKVVLRFADQLNLPGDSPALDVGCGAGYLAVSLAKRGYRMDAVDRVPAMIAQARALAAQHGLQHRVHAHVGDVCDLRFLSAPPKLITAVGVAPWLPSLKEALSEIWQALQPGGYLILTCDNRWALGLALDPRCFPPLTGLRWKIRDRLEDWGLRERCSRPDFERYSRRHMDGLLAAAGFSKIDSCTVGFGRFTFLNQRLFSPKMSHKIDVKLQALADRQFPIVRSTGIEYVVVCQKTSGESMAR